MIDTDVVVVGSGCAGLSAAVTAAVGGARVVMLERASVLGGTTAISGGGMWLPANGLDPDFADSLEDAKAYLQRLTMGLASEAVLDRFLAESRAVIDYFEEHTPLRFGPDKGRPDYHAPWVGSSTTSRTVFSELYDLNRLGDLKDKVRRPPWPGGIPPVMHNEEASFGDPSGLLKTIEERIATGIAARGLALVGGLLEACVEHGVTILTEVRVQSLVIEDGAVVGAEADVAGERVRYRTTAGVVLGSGGFEWNRELWKHFMAVPWDGPSSPPFNEGDGLKMAMRAGAQLASMHRATWIPARYVGEENEGQPYMRMGVYGGRAGQILVNRKGQRFANEALNYNDIGVAMTHFDPHEYQFPNHPCWVVSDARQFQSMVAEQPKGEWPEDGDVLMQAETIRELAEKLAIDPDGLEAQVAEFNRHAERGEDPVFRRGEKPWELHIQLPADLPNPALAPLITPPFAGHRVRAGVFGTRGGPVIDENAQILDPDNRPIPGLYGAGNVIAHPFANAYPGGGATLGPAIVFGHVAGRSILSRLPT